MHNLVRLMHDGSTVTQVEGAPRCNMRALADTEHYSYGVAQVTPIYNGKPQVAKVEREFLFIKPATFVVFDRVEVSPGTSRIWTLNLPGEPTLEGERIGYANGSNRLDVLRLAPVGLSSTWVAGSRVETVHSVGTQSLFLHVLGTNGSVGAATRADASGQTGALITLADGRSATVRFSNTGTGATLELRAPNGSLQFDAALPSTVIAPPLFRN